MALTVSNVDSFSQDIWGRHRVAVVSVTFDTSYATGGESFTPADAGMSEFSFVSISADHSPAYQFAYDYANKKILVFGVEQDADAAVTDPFDEENAAADLSTVTVRVLCVGH